MPANKINIEVIPPSGESDRNVIGVQEVGELLCRLPQADILFCLTLDGNNFTGEGIYVLAGFMHLCPFLTRLSCINCGITSEDLLLLDVIFGENSSDNQCPCKELIKWRLDHNRIDDRGFSALMERLPSQFPKLGYACFLDKVFVFDGNPVSPELARVMNDEMERRYKVYKMWIMLDLLLLYNLLLCRGYRRILLQLNLEESINKCNNHKWYDYPSVIFVAIVISVLIFYRKMLIANHPQQIPFMLLRQVTNQNLLHQILHHYLNQKMLF